MCTLWRCKSMPTWNKLLSMTSHSGPTSGYCMKCHTNTISHFHLIVHYVSGGEFFTGNYILWHHLNFVAASDKWIWRVPEVRNDDPVLLTLDLLNPKSIGFNRRSRTTTVPSFKSFLSGAHTKIPRHPPTHIHTHIDMLITISSPAYSVIDVDVESKRQLLNIHVCKYSTYSVVTTCDSRRLISNLCASSSGIGSKFYVVNIVATQESRSADWGRGEAWGGHFVCWEHQKYFWQLELLKRIGTSYEGCSFSRTQSSVFK